MTLDHLMDEIRKLSPLERKRLILLIVDTLEQSNAPRERVPGLNAHLGRGWMSDDFDEALPDSFWLGGETA